MAGDTFRTTTGQRVPSVSAAEMREVDRIAVEDVGLALLQMMENAGRALAWHVREFGDGDVLVVAGDGGNGGGGLACARHLANHDGPVRVVLDRPAAELTGAAAHQHRILDEMAVPITTGPDPLVEVDGSTTLVDALIGYGLDGAVRTPASTYVERMNEGPGPVVSLDVPSGVNATSGETPGVAVTPDRTVTLALPKPGLAAVAGELFLADIGIPATVYERLGIEYDTPFGEADWVELER